MSNSLLSRARAKLEREVLEIEHRTDLTDQQKRLFGLIDATDALLLVAVPVDVADDAGILFAAFNIEFCDLAIIQNGDLFFASIDADYHLF